MKKSFDGNIYLTGFMGSGKSTIAPVLANKMNRASFDTDLWIENNYGKSIYQIFKDEGEESFREKEAYCLELVSQMKQFVVAVGGGAIVSSDNWINLKKSGIIIYLKCSMETIWERIKSSESRPLLPQNESERFEKVKSLLTLRSPFYERADIIFPCETGDSTDKTADHLKKLIEAFI